MKNYVAAVWKHSAACVYFQYKTALLFKIIAPNTDTSIL